MEDRPAKTMAEEMERLENWCDLRATEFHERDSDKRAVKMINLKSDLKKQRRSYEENPGEYDVVTELEGLIEWTDTVIQQRVGEEPLPQLELSRIADFGQHVRARLINYQQE